MTAHKITKKEIRKIPVKRFSKPLKGSCKSISGLIRAFPKD